MRQFRYQTGLFLAILPLAISSLVSQTAPTKADRHQLFLARLSTAAIERTNHVVRYDPGYVGISYPNGDVPADSGVCSDEVIRSYRTLGIDLQPLVHEDMKAHFNVYPKGTRTLDRNIDHRRVPNLMVFFSRNGEKLPITGNADDYSPGDLVTWDLNPKRGIPHIGIVVDQKSPDSGRYMIVHNIGEGPKMEDVLFDWKITGHYRYYGPGKN
jgi:uncharacterized protein YijF (DUF1287 family)